MPNQFEIQSVVDADNFTITMPATETAAGITANGTATFEFFDDFDGTTLNTLNWTNCATNSAIVSAGLLTLSSGSGSNTSSVTHKWIDGVCEEFIINEFDEGEDEIEGLNVCKFIFNCKITRDN